MKIYDSDIYMKDLCTSGNHVLNLESLNGKGVMITGSSGTIGSFIVDMLMNYNHTNDGYINVVACGRNPDKLRERFCRFSGGDHLSFAKFDLLHAMQNCGYEGNIDFLIHAAGNAYPSAFIDEAEDTVRGNILGTWAVLNMAASKGLKRFVYVSSGEVYSVLDDYDSLLDETLDKCNGDPEKYFLEVNRMVSEKGPRSCYPISKLAAEKLCTYGNRDYDSIIVRPCHTFGPGITGKDDRAHVQFAMMAARGEDIVLNSPGTQLRSYNYVADAASAIMSTMTSGKSGEIYDICSPDNTITIYGLAKLIADAGLVDVVVKEPDARQKSIQSPISRQVLDCDKLLKLGWTKAFSLEDGTRHFVKIVEGIYT